MTDKDEILAAIAAQGATLREEMRGLGARLETRMDVMANGIGRIETELATVKGDVAQLRIDVAAYRMESNARLTVVEQKLA